MTELKCEIHLAGIQGAASEDWYTFGAKLSTPTYLIPLTKSKDATTIEAITESIYNTVVDCFSQQQQFYLVGYSFGAIVALQLAQLMERSGKEGRVVLIDGSPIYLQKFFVSMAATDTRTGIEDMLIMLLFFNLTRANQTYDFIDQLRYAESLKKKTNLLLRYFPETLASEYSTEYLGNIITAMANRLSIIFQANHTDDMQQFVKLKSLITLVRPAHVSIADIPKDYGLEKYAEQPIDVRVVSGNYLKILSSDEVAEIVDKAAPTE